MYIDSIYGKKGNSSGAHCYIVPFQHVLPKQFGDQWVKIKKFTGALCNFQLQISV